MPNQPDVNKVIRSIQIPLELMAVSFFTKS